MDLSLTDHQTDCLKSLIKARIKYWEKELDKSTKPRDASLDWLIQFQTDEEHQKQCAERRKKADKHLKPLIEIACKLDLY